MDLEASLWAAVKPVLLDNADPSGWGSSNPARPPSCNIGEASKALALVQRHHEQAPQSKTAAAPPQAPLTRHGGQPPFALFSSLILIKECPQANCPAGMTSVLRWLLNKVQRLSGRAFVSHDQKHARESLQRLLGSSAQNMSYLTYW